MRASLLVASVIGGSFLWWAAITGFVSLFRDRMTDTGLVVLNKVSAVIIVLFGAGILGRLLLS